MYLVPGVKGLPGGVDLVCHAGLDPPGIIMESRVCLVSPCIDNLPFVVRRRM